ncbi:hypothetical protein I545_6804 [Mycobacterium kansasii 662]|uniref:Uncharacterized protein n=1 Tax=Mycobacterium kansasii 662 TaxID=1299326 RepID=X7XST7_MYCKA|nr:hypothetical protein I545_6804 [Mycobacterium kansasii 662]
MHVEGRPPPVATIPGSDLDDLLLATYFRAALARQHQSSRSVAGLVATERARPPSTCMITRFGVGTSVAIADHRADLLDVRA